jgi:RecB family exonuclease
MAGDIDNQIREVVMKAYSHSSLSTFEQCPRKYKFRYIEKFDIGDRQSVEGFRGKIVHEALQRLYELKMDGKIWSEEDLLSYYDKNWDQQRPSELFIKDEELSESDFRDKGRLMLAEYYRAHHPFDEDRSVALERYVTINLDPEGEYRIKGIIDRLAVRDDGTMVIHDYKTAKSIKPQVEIDEDRQLALYQIAVRQMWPDRDKFELVWHYLAIPEDRMSTRTDEDLDSLIESTIQSIRELEQARDDDEFPTSESRLCNWCEYMSFCPAKIHGLGSISERGEPMEEDVVRAVDRLAEIKRIVHELSSETEVLKGQIAGYALAKGLTVIAGNDKDVSIRFPAVYRPKYAASRHKEEERRRFVEFLIRSDMIGEVFSYSSQGFHSFISKAKYNPAYKEELFDLIERVDQKPVVSVRNKRD